MPDKKERFQLYSDTSKFATGSALYQITNRKPNLIADVSKRLLGAAKNYSITELEMCGLAINIISFAHLLKKVDFDAVVDHLALSHRMKNKLEPVTTRIKRLLEVLSSDSFNQHYIKGKDMILIDFLSRQRINDSNPHKIILISFNMRDILQENYYNFENMKLDDKYLVQTRSQAKSCRVKVHGVDKSLDLHIRPVKQKSVSPSVNMKPPTPKPRTGQGRTCVKRKVRIVLPNQTADPAIISLPETIIKETIQTEHKSPSQVDTRQPVGPRVENRKVPFYSDPVLRPPPKAARLERK